MAMFSRSAKPLDENLAGLNQEKASKFFDAFYHKYGHASIADMAHIPMAMEDVSILAAMTIEDQPLWDGQERSTRYQDYSKGQYYVPSEAPELYHSLMQGWYKSYANLLEAMMAVYRDQYPKPSIMSDKGYEETIRARAFDVARYLLPLGTLTSVAQITSARALEEQICRLNASSYTELQDVASMMRDAALLPPDDNTGPLAPTLLRHANMVPTYVPLTSLTMLDWVRKIPGMTVRTPDTTMTVELHESTNLVDTAIAGLLYSASDLSYNQVMGVVMELSAGEREDILKDAFHERGPHDAWLNQFRGGQLIFDIFTDVGAMRDLRRHRRTNKIHQELTTYMGCEVPEPIMATPLQGVYTQGMQSMYAGITQLQSQWKSVNARYTLPLAHRTRSIFMMDLAEAAYIIELRTRSAGHFSYRRTSWEMYRCLIGRYPELKNFIRATNPREGDFFKR
jgi:thymidylate synthase ThyX